MEPLESLKRNVEKFISSFCTVLVQPSCRVFEFVYETSPEEYLKTTAIRGAAWIRRDSQLGSIDFMVTCVNGYKRIILNDLAVYSYNDVQWKRLFSLNDEAWKDYFSAGKKVSVIFPNTRISMKR